MNDDAQLDRDAERLVGQARRAIQMLCNGVRKPLEPDTKDDRRNGYYAMAAKPSFLIEESPSSWKGPISDWYDDDRAPLVIGHAERGESDAHEALQGMIAMFARDDLPLPPRLSRYAIRIAIQREPKPKRGAPIINDVRDMVIAAAVAWLQRLAIPPTRNSDLRGCVPPTSGCSLVPAALLLEFGIEVSEATVEDIWRKRKRGVAEDLVDWFEPPAALLHENKSALKKLRKIAGENCPN